MVRISGFESEREISGSGRTKRSLSNIWITLVDGGDGVEGGGGSCFSWLISAQLVFLKGATVSRSLSLRNGPIDAEAEVVRISGFESEREISGIGRAKRSLSSNGMKIAAEKLNLFFRPGSVFNRRPSENSAIFSKLANSATVHFFAFFHFVFFTFVR